MNNHSPAYNTLMDKADKCHEQFDERFERAFHDRKFNRIDDDDWYLMLAETDDLERQYVQLRDQAIMADRMYWLEHAADIAQAHDRMEQQKEETQLRNGG